MNQSKHILNDAPNAGNNPVNWIIRLTKGVLIGVGAILPGLSGGVLSVIFGIYQPLINFLSNIKKNFLANLNYFLPVLIGAGAGILLFSVAVEAAFGTYAAQFVCLFIGFVIGTFPSLYKQAGKEGRNTNDLIILILSTLFIFALMFFGKDLPDVKPNFIVWLLSGALVALGMLVPGMSPSNFLIYFGLYDKMAASIADLNISMLIPFVLGALTCIFALSKVIHWLFNKIYSKMFHMILGLVIGSSLAIFPSTVFPAYTPQGLQASGLSFEVALIFGITMLILGVIASYLFSKLEDKVDRQ